MNTMLLRFVLLMSVVSLVLVGCAPSGETPEPVVVDESQPTLLQGTYNVTNDFVLTRYYVENAVALVDMRGFVIRDEEWELPVASQVLGFMTFDAESLSGTYELNLPALPRGEFNDVDNDGVQDVGVQVYAVAYSPNLYGGPFSEGDDRSRGWPSYLASIKTDRENKDEVIGGKLVVWAVDAEQSFPSGFGADGLLFTVDDPVMSLPAGYSVIDLDQEPFAIIRDAEAELTLFEPQDIAIKDFSSMSYTEAFDAMFETVRKEYAFTDIEGKAPDWDTLYEEIHPRVEQAEQDKNPNDFYLALRDFTWAFKDGHVGLDGGDYANADFSTATAGGYGFAIRELDSGRVTAMFIVEGGPAQAAGMQVGAEIFDFNGVEISEAISGAQSYALQSSDFAIRYQKARYLVAAPAGTEASIIFANPGEPVQTVTLTAVTERQSFNRTSVNFGVDRTSFNPVDARFITEGSQLIGYIRINTNSDDLALIIRLFERALQRFEANQVAGIVIDMRYNTGGAPLGLAGFLTDQEIDMGQLEYYSEKTGKFESEGLPERILPNQNQYRFDKMTLLVGQACFSACEIEAYGFSQVPGMIVVGQTPTAGVEAETARGSFILPENFSLTVPTGRFVLPGGGIFLEGQGVPPTLRVPVDEVTAISLEDVVLQAAIKAVLEPAGAGITPSAPPKLAAGEEAQNALSGGASFLESAAREQYTDAEYSIPGVLKYTIALSKSEVLIWAYAWCAQDTATLEENFSQINLKFTLAGKNIPLEQFSVFEVESGGQQCRLVYTALSDWKPGEHRLSTQIVFMSGINDGTSDYAAGNYTYDYTVYVRP
ncbi:MAG: S41 family peptidase [Anaerolineales bacterium]|nr:S41 family peptidase [Anaerolineales bacterium]